MITGAYFHHTSLRARNYDRALAFYQALGLSLYVEWNEESGRCCFLKADDQTFLEIKEYLGEVKSPGILQHICFHSDDVDAFCAAAVANGARIRRAPLELPLPCSPKPIEKVRLCHLYGPNDEEIEVINWYGFQLQEE